jgi:hypothetical protein
MKAEAWRELQSALNGNTQYCGHPATMPIDRAKLVGAMRMIALLP